MFKKILIMFLICTLLTGCWDYIGLNNLVIVSGIAIDKVESNKYKITLEIISISESVKNKVPKTKIIESKGNNILDAVRNTEKMIMNKLYFGDAHVIVISNEIAKKDGVDSIIDVFLRTSDTRETISVIVSQEETAGELLKIKTIDNTVNSFEIKKILWYSSELTDSTKDIHLYNVFNIIKDSSKNLVLPLFTVKKNNKKNIVVSNGLGFFKKDKLIGNLSPSQSKYFLFIDNSINGGILSFKSGDNNDENVALNIMKNTTKKDYSYSNNKLQIKIKTSTITSLSEYDNRKEEIDEKKLSKLELEAEKVIQKKIKKLIQQAQSEFKVDIFSFGNLIYKKDYKLWKKIKKEWDELFTNADIVVESNINIANTSFLK